MAPRSNSRSHLRTGTTLLLLALTVVATVAASSLVLTGIFFLLYLPYFREVPSITTLLAFFVCSMVCVLAVVAWEERYASDYMVSALGATPADEDEYPKLHSLVRSVSQQADIPAPKLYSSPTETPLSLTTGFRPGSARLILSDSMVTMLSDDELEAVVAHELAHVKNRDTAVMMVASLAIGAADRVVTILTGYTEGAKYGQPSRASYADFCMTLGPILVPPLWICGYACWASLSRTREFAADGGAVALTGNPAALASALRRIDETIESQPTTDLRTVDVEAFAIVESNRAAPVGPFPLLGRPLTLRYPTHPATEHRIERLRAVEREQELSSEAKSKPMK